MASFLQVELDAIDSFADVATASGLAPGDISIGLLRLWRFCFRAKTNCVSSDRLATFFAGDMKRIVTALVACEFIRPLEDRKDTCGYYIKGTDRYVKAAKARSEGGKKRAEKAARARNGQLETQKEPASAGVQLDSSPAASQLPTSSLSYNPISNNPKSYIQGGEAPPGDLRERLEESFRDIRQRGFKWTTSHEHDLREILPEGREEILRRWRIGLKWQGYPRCDSLRDLVKHWNAYAQDQPSPKKRGAQALTTDAEFLEETKHLQTDENGDLIL